MASAAMMAASSDSTESANASMDVHENDYCSAGSRSPGEIYRHQDEDDDELDARRGYLNDGNVNSRASFSPIDGDFDGGKKNRRKKSKPMRIPSTSSTGALDMSTLGSSRQQDDNEEDDDDNKELEAGQLPLTFSRPSSTGSADVPLDLCSGGEQKGRIRVANLMPDFESAKYDGSLSPTDEGEHGNMAEWHTKLQESLPSFLAGAKGVNWPQDLGASIGELKAQAEFLAAGQQFSGGPGPNFLPNFLQPSPFLPFLLPHHQASTPASSAPMPVSMSSSSSAKNSVSNGTKSSGELGALAIPKPLIVGGGPGAGPPIRIFNPEAYCHLCNKEFCNKYFLKTHKANKHGIYSGDGPPPCKPTGQSGSSSNPESPGPKPSPFLPMTFLGTPLGPTPQTPAPLPPFRPVGSSSRKSGAVASDPNKPINPEAFCVVCKKEFCNKYFLKRHKLKIHGITPTEENGGKQDSGQRKDENGFLAKSRPPSDAHSDASHRQKSASKSPAPSHSSPMGTPTVGLGAFSCKAGKVICESRQQLEQHIQVAHGDPLASQSTSWAAQQDEHEQGHVRTIPKEIFQLVSKESLVEKLKDHGVVNPELICQECGKEFAEAMFLMRHLQTKHKSQNWQGEENGPSKFGKSQVLEEGQMPFWKQNDAQGMMETPRGLVSPSAKQPASNSSRAHAARKEEQKKQAENSSAEVVCKECDRPFQNAYWLGIHQQYSHPGAGKEQKESERTQVTSEGTQAGSGLESAQQREGGAGELEKLQSMLVGLNTISGQESQSCELCARQFDNPAFLKIHMIEEHGVVQGFSKATFNPPVSVPNPFLQLGSAQGPMAPESQQPESFFLCPICKQGFSQRELLMRHLHSAHSLPPAQQKVTPSPPSKPAKTPGGRAADPAAPKPEKKTTWSTSRSYCQICNKELCNKYFMKTHMLKMHGINVEINGANNAGAMCDICNKVLCSKYFLRVHKQNTHGIPDPDLPPGGFWDPNFPGIEGVMGPEGNLLAKMNQELQKACGSVNSNDSPPKKKSKPASKSLAALKQQGAINPVDCPFCPATYLDKPGLQVHLARTHPREVESGEIPEGKLEEAAPRVFHCSLCLFNTHSLPTLMAHQNCHTSPQDADAPRSAIVTMPSKEAEKRAEDQSPSPGAPGTMQCPVCFAWLPSIQVFHQHILSHRLNPFMAPFLGQLDQSFEGMQRERSPARSPHGQSDEEGQGFQNAEAEDDSSGPVTQFEQQQELLRRIFHASAEQSEITQFLAAQAGNKLAAFAKSPEGCSLSKTSRRKPKFSCSVCKKSFRKKTACLSHIQDAHNPRNKSVTYVWSESVRKRMRLFRCSRCSFSSSRLFKVKDHIRKSHKTPSKPKGRKDNVNRGTAEEGGLPGVHPGQLQQLMVAMGLSAGLGLGGVPMSALFTQKPPRSVDEAEVTLGKDLSGTYLAHDFLALEPTDEDRHAVSSPAAMSPPSPVHQLNKTSHNQVRSGLNEQAVAN